MLQDIDGIEVFYPDHDPVFRQELINIARERSLEVSGGSDDHLSPKDGKQYKMGSVEIPNIPETQWIQDSILTGQDMLKRSIGLKNAIQRLRALKEKYTGLLQEDKTLSAQLEDKTPIQINE